MGFSGFDYQSAADIFSEHAALSAFENDSHEPSGLRDFNISGLANLTPTEYDALQPIKSPVLSKSAQGTARLPRGQFFTPNRLARFCAIKLSRTRECAKRSILLSKYRPYS